MHIPSCSDLDPSTDSDISMEISDAPSESEPANGAVPASTQSLTLALLVPQGDGDAAAGPPPPPLLFSSGEDSMDSGYPSDSESDPPAEPANVDVQRNITHMSLMTRDVNGRWSCLRFSGRSPWFYSHLVYRLNIRNHVGKHWLECWANVLWKIWQNQNCTWSLCLLFYVWPWIGS